MFWGEGGGVAEGRRGGGRVSYFSGGLERLLKVREHTRGYQKVLSLRHFPHSDSTMLHT